MATIEPDNSLTADNGSRILCSDPNAQYQAHKAAIDAAIARFLGGNQYILGDEVAAFERQFAEFLGVPDAVGVANGTEALFLALKARDIGVGDEVITVSLTAIATVAAIAMTGAQAALVDVGPHSYTLDPDCLEAAITARTKAVVAVHLYGQPVDMAAIVDIAERHGLPVIEDCAQAAGAGIQGRRVGSFGDFGCFSFYPTKNLGALGDGGAVTVADPADAQRLRMLREYGWDAERRSQLPGINSRLDGIQAAVLSAKLPFLDDDNTRRAAIAAHYDEGLAGLPVRCPRPSQDGTHAYHLYVIAVDERDKLKAHLAGAGIAAGIHYPTPVHLERGYRDHIRITGTLARSERLAGQVLSLPIYPELGKREVAQVIATVAEFYGR